MQLVGIFIAEIMESVLNLILKTAIIFTFN